LSPHVPFTLDLTGCDTVYNVTQTTRLEERCWLKRHTYSVQNVIISLFPPKYILIKDTHVIWDVRFLHPYRITTEAVGIETLDNLA
jgi:hypothetical protein